MFQNSVRADQGHGIVGELGYDGPLRAQPFIIRENATAANCVVGRAFTIDTATNKVIPGGDVSTLPFAGILANPKVYASVGAAAGTLAPSLLVLPGTQAEFVSMTTGIWASVPETAKVGDLVYADTTTGELHVYPLDGTGTPPGTQKRIPNCFVERSAQANVPGLVLIKLTN